ncbi:hypothetical protein [Micromonospora echinaurantiaca]|uniref:hypothetical protein n=1 Tax=Micromonospora echinaurantiaca TaxID=47857 RepID=UPI0012FD09DD|nr:hypothetical protein [Micromonospora echinaurantiaca]
MTLDPYSAIVTLRSDATAAQRDAVRETLVGIKGVQFLSESAAKTFESAIRDTCATHGSGIIVSSSGSGLIFDRTTPQFFFVLLDTTQAYDRVTLAVAGLPGVDAVERPHSKQGCCEALPLQATEPPYHNSDPSTIGKIDAD